MQKDPIPIQNLLAPATAGLQTTIHPFTTVSPEADRFDWRWSYDGATAAERTILERMLFEAKRFVTAAQRGEQPYIFSLLGLSEVGKTHLAKRVCAFFHRHLEVYTDTNTPTGLPARLCRRGGRVEWRMVASMARSGDWGAINDLQQDWMLILDDVGAEHQTENQFTVSVLDGILNERVGRRWTMVTANKTLRSISQEWDTRIASRLRRDGGVHIDLAPGDIRLFEQRRRKAA